LETFAGNPPYSIPPYSSCERLSSSMSTWTLQYRRGPQPRPYVAPSRHALLLDVATEQAVVLSVWRALQTTGAGNSRLDLALHIPVYSSLGGRSRSAVAQAVDEEVE
jgi:hypothetical protein